MKGKLDEYGSELAEMVKSHPDATLSEYCEYFGEKNKVVVAALNPEESIAYLRLTSIKDESVLVVTHLKDPIMDEVVNVHNNDDITLFR
ncbi:MAG: hypothetical protein KME32_31310 [Mojavia pulchra JT2-VF2]|jgi:hypothetical protein|uniref:Uncharacterized protein n=1 Tax=Mojavia pulchra JT2-VF2 TaxID=287848 RepID=A0A951Q6E5_9NOST|nr:hypothetical protein [Mojavia pulchra JT2-VF2]